MNGGNDGYNVVFVPGGSSDNFNDGSRNVDGSGTCTGSVNGSGS